jgi:hypothetical protein
MRVHARVGAGAVLLLALGVKSRIVQNCARPKQLYGSNQVHRYCRHSSLATAKRLSSNL